MNHFLIAFGTLWVLICVYAVLAHHFATSEPDVPSSCELPRWPGREVIMPTSHLRERRGTSRLRLQRCAKSTSRKRKFYVLCDIGDESYNGAVNSDCVAYRRDSGTE
ncbi:hypothetical protein AWB83_03144 [Caballeronia ptereochthonis]|uniref:Uncharacterized protein n=1 Tax=Caballeronia ptereochthonis TaxID=1777144 RepID=A0A158BDI2_9BURK|nr:hypothetical protein AWB83_03144 [Caballeronia ptereochthonis]